MSKTAELKVKELKLFTQILGWEIICDFPAYSSLDAVGTQVHVWG